jgi:hypothetical protein
VSTHSIPDVDQPAPPAPASAPGSPLRFQAAVCAHFQCAPEDYVVRVLRHCLHRHARLLACGSVSPRGLFGPDCELIEHLAPVSSLAELHREVNHFRYAQARSSNPFRSLFRFRLSGARLIRLGARLFKPGS